MDRIRKARSVFRHVLILSLSSLLASPAAIAESSERESALQDDLAAQQGAISRDLENNHNAKTGRRLASNGSMSDFSEIPKNAHAKSYRSGWECDQGFQEANGKCAAVQVPENAYPTDSSYGRGWGCSRGYRRSGAACAAMLRPVNAFLNS